METNTACILTVHAGRLRLRRIQVRERKIDDDGPVITGKPGWLGMGLSLFASGMGAWVLLTPSEVAYYGGFWDVLGYAVSSMTPFLLLAYVGPMIGIDSPRESHWRLSGIGWVGPCRSTSG